MRCVNLAGRVFGKLIAICPLPTSDSSGHKLWKCQCSCGNVTEVSSTNLLRGNTTSCGCFREEHLRVNRKDHWIHGATRAGVVTPEYQSWHAMLQRCGNPHNVAYKYYGGRGIKVCRRWLKFENFLKDMGRRPAGLTLDRRNNDKGYLKSNCRWATRFEQSRNRRRHGKYH